MPGLVTDPICPAGCGMPRQPGHLTCRRCWGLVPRELRLDINYVWQRLCGPALDRELRAIAAIAWFNMANRAVEAVKAKLKAGET